MANENPKLPWEGPNYRSDDELVRFAYGSTFSQQQVLAAMEIKDGARPIGKYSLPEYPWEPLADRNLSSIEDERTGLSAMAFLNDRTQKILIVYRSADDVHDLNASKALMADGELIALSGFPVTPRGDTPKQQMADLQTKVFTTINGDVFQPQFAQSLDYAKRIRDTYAPQGYTVEVAGFGLGGSHAELAAHTLGLGGRSFDAMGAANIAASPGYKAWLQANGIATPPGPKPFSTRDPFDQGFLNYTVRFSDVSQKSGDHLGQTRTVSALAERENLASYGAYALGTATAMVSDLPGSELLQARGMAGAMREGAVVKEVGKGMAETLATQNIDVAERHSLERLVRVFDRAARENALPTFGQQPTQAPAAPERHSADLRDPSHPGHAEFSRTLREVHYMEAGQGIASGPHSEKVAAALLVKGEREGLRITNVTMGADGQVQGLQRLGVFDAPKAVTVDPRQAQAVEMSDYAAQWAQLRSPHLLSQAPPAERSAAQAQGIAALSAADQAMFARIRQDVPAHIGDDHVAQAMLGAKQAGIADAGRIDRVLMTGDSVWVAGTTPGFRAFVDVAQPAAPLQATAQQAQAFNQQREQQLAMETQQRQQEGPGGRAAPAMG